jgi:hypothetical protein
LGSRAGRRSGWSSRRRRSHRQERGFASRVKSAVPRYAVVFIALAMLAIGALMSWVTLRYFMALYSHGGKPAEQTSSAAGLATPAEIANARLQRNVLSDFAKAAQQAKSGAIDDAEEQVDQAASEMENARVQSQAALVPASEPTAEFFIRAEAALDAVVKAQPSGSQDTAQSMADGHLLDHVAEARIELAEMRSSEEPMPPGSTLAADAQAHAASVAAEADAEQAAAAQAGSSSAAPGKAAVRPVAAAHMGKLPVGHVVIAAPRELAANDLLDPAALGGNFLDASVMPDEVEILLPPETRQFSDNVRVENLTIAGASQTLDGIHWRNVTFIRTRLRYEDGQLDLQNVRFVRCTFGFPSDERGASVANAIALGKTSIEIQ